MPLTPLRESRRTIRLRDWDYAAAGAYYITICTAQRGDVLARIAGDSAGLTPLGELVETELLHTREIRPAMRLGAFVVMPNHLHAVLWLAETDDGRPVAPLGAIVGGFKSTVTRRARDEHGWCGPFWQRNYYEHIVRDELDLARIEQYIRDNPARWANDPENPVRRTA